jgi:hypothetical protein
VRKTSCKRKPLSRKACKKYGASGRNAPRKSCKVGAPSRKERAQGSSPTGYQAARAHAAKPRCHRGIGSALHSAGAMGRYGITPFLGAEPPDLTLVQGESCTLPPQREEPRVPAFNAALGKPSSAERGAGQAPTLARHSSAGCMS